MQNQKSFGTPTNGEGLGEMRIFYYTRRNFMRNWCEMMGSSNFFRWVIPIPYFKR